MWIQCMSLAPCAPRTKLASSNAMFATKWRVCMSSPKTSERTQITPDASIVSTLILKPSPIFVLMMPLIQAAATMRKKKKSTMYVFESTSCTFHGWFSLLTILSGMLARQGRMSTRSGLIYLRIRRMIGHQLPVRTMKMNLEMSHLLLHPIMVVLPDSRDTTFRHVPAPHSVLRLCLIPVLTSPLTPAPVVLLLSKTTMMNGKLWIERGPLGARVEPHLLPRAPVIHHSSQPLGRTDGQRFLRLHNGVNPRIMCRRKKAHGPVMVARSRGCWTIETSNIALFFPSSWNSKFRHVPVFLLIQFSSSLHPASSISYHFPLVTPHLFPWSLHAIPSITNHFSLDSNAGAVFSYLLSLFESTKCVKSVDRRTESS